MREILRLPANSLAGLRAKMLVAIFANESLWDKLFQDIDWHERTVRSVIEAARVLAGIPVPQECTDDDGVVDDADEAGSRPGSAALN